MRQIWLTKTFKRQFSISSFYVADSWVKTLHLRKTTIVFGWKKQNLRLSIQSAAHARDTRYHHPSFCWTVIYYTGQTLTPLLPIDFICQPVHNGENCAILLSYNRVKAEMVLFKNFPPIAGSVLTLVFQILSTYSGANWKVYEYCFMKQNCQLQMGIAQYKNVAITLRTLSIITTYQHFQMRYITLF